MNIKFCKYPKLKCERVGSSTRSIIYKGKTIKLCKHHYRIMTRLKPGAKHEST
jgi:hypothetical protein